MRAARVLILLAVSLRPEVAAAQGSATRAAVRANCEWPLSEDVVASVSARGELLLASGRTITFLDIRLPSDDDDLGMARAWLQSLVGRRVALAAPSGAADRWGRIAADLTLPDVAAPISLAEHLVDEGLAMVDAGGRRTLCRPELLAREERARAQRKGIWAGDRHGPHEALGMRRLQGQVGRFAIVQGVVRSVGERRERTYLNFGPDWTSDLTITIPKRTRAMMAEQGLSATALRGRRVRARGMLEEWQGVTVEITAPDMLEVLAQEPRRP